MNEKEKQFDRCRGVTIIELVIAVAMVTIIFAAILPQFVIIRNSWDIKQASAETNQNGRVLMDHIERNISSAKKITIVSNSSTTSGYIEFVDYNDVNNRYDIRSANNYVEFGPLGSLSDLAGPVSSLKFTCYDACDLTTPITDCNDIRVVKIEAAFPNASPSGQSKTFTAWAYLRVNSQNDTGWSDDDIGSVAASGSASFSSSTDKWTVIGSGVDIWNNTDEYHYVYQTLSGDGQIVAKVLSVTNTDPWAKAGVMIRESLTGGSKHAMMVVTPGNGTAFQRRINTGGVSDHTQGSATAAAPYWVKLVRKGNTFTSYASLDGADWGNAVDRVSITMATDVYIGLCVTSHNDGALCTADFNNVSFLTYNSFYENRVSSDRITILTPASNAGDLLIAAVATNANTTFSDTAGWTLINQDSFNNTISLAVWKKIASASESANYTFNWTGTRLAYGWIMCFSGQDTDPVKAINALATGHSAGSSNPVSPAVTTTADCAMILRIGAFAGDNITTDVTGLAGHSSITMDKSANVLFQDGFEANFDKWTDGGVTDFSQQTDEHHSGSHSARASKNDTYLTSDNINTSAYNSFTLEFWFQDHRIDSSDNVFLKLYNGSSYVNSFNLGNSTEDVWNYYSATITDAQYCRNNFRLRYDASGIGNNEHLWIDDVIITAGGVSGGAGYVKQAAAGNSGTSNFSLSAAKDACLLTIAITPDSTKASACCGNEIRP